MKKLVKLILIIVIGTNPGRIVLKMLFLILILILISYCSSYESYLCNEEVDTHWPITNLLSVLFVDYYSVEAKEDRKK